MHHHFFQNLTRSVTAAQKGGLINWLRQIYRICADIDEEAVYYASLVSISSVTSVVNGKVVVRDGRLSGGREESIASKANKISRRLLSTIN